MVFISEFYFAKVIKGVQWLNRFVPGREVWSKLRKGSCGRLVVGGGGGVSGKQTRNSAI